LTTSSGAVEQRGLVGYETMPFLALYGPAAIETSRDAHSAADLERIALTASGLTEVGIARYARERIDLLAP
jgi:hypothetical protein